MQNYKNEVVEYLDNIKSNGYNAIENLINELKQTKYVCLFGIGMVCDPIVECIRKYTDVDIDFLCDNDPAKWGKNFFGDLICLSPKELTSYKDDISIIITTQHYDSVFDQLYLLGFKKFYVLTEYNLINNDYLKKSNNIDIIKANILNVLDILADDTSRKVLVTVLKSYENFEKHNVKFNSIRSDDQYYADIIELTNNEVLVDGGSYDGDSILDFLTRVNGFQSIFSFELDSDNFSKLEKTINKLNDNVKSKIILYNLGLYDQEKIINLDSGGKANARVNISTSGERIAKVVRMSDVLKDKDITFIKMDIEGAELNALQGAEQLIKKNRPKLAICVYHRIPHLWEIPFYLKSIVPEYKIYFRHHTSMGYETVCYAVL